jgi:hypothetical protein
VSLSGSSGGGVGGIGSGVGVGGGVGVGSGGSGVSGGGGLGHGGASYISSTITSPVHLICKNKEEKLDLVQQAMTKLKYESTDQKNYVEHILKKEDSTRQTIAHLAIANNHLRILELLFVQFDLDRDIKVKYY